MIYARHLYIYIDPYAKTPGEKGKKKHELKYFRLNNWGHIAIYGLSVCPNIVAGWVHSCVAMAPPSGRLGFG